MKCVGLETLIADAVKAAGESGPVYVAPDGLRVRYDTIRVKTEPNGGCFSEAIVTFLYQGREVGRMQANMQYGDTLQMNHIDGSFGITLDAD
jgi:hypothetical protein